MQTNQDMKDSGVAWLGDIPIDWQSVRGKFLYQYKKVLNKGLVEPQRLALTLKGVIERHDGDGVGLNPESLESYQIFNAGDLVFKLIDLENKKTSRVGLVHKRGIMSPAYIRTTPTKQVFTKYFYYYYYSLYLTYIFNNIAGEGVRANLSPRELLELPVTVPDIRTQEKIANYLDQEIAKIDDMITKQERLLKLLEEKRRVTITNAVTNDNWPRRKIKYIATKRDHKVQGAKDVPYIGLEHVESFSGKRIDAEAQSEPEGLTLGYKAGDVLFGKLRPYLAKVLLTNDSGVCSSEFIVLNATDKLLPEFLKYSLLNKQFIELINSSTYGAKMPRANWEFIGNATIALPPLDQQKKIVEHVKSQEILTAQLKQSIFDQIDLLKERRVSLISHVVTGKIKV